MEHEPPKPPKTIDELMGYLCSKEKNPLRISGDAQKQDLRNMGYYHGYKGYRYCRKVNNELPYTDFDQLRDVYDFDMRIKTLLYPWVMFLETALKNYTLEIVLEKRQSSVFEDVCQEVLSINKPVDLLKFYRTAYEVLVRDSSRPAVRYFYEKNKSMPIWAVFEVFSMGNLGEFLGLLQQPYREKLSQAIGLPMLTGLPSQKDDDEECRLSQQLVHTLKYLRNAIAHNAPIFDARFNLDNNKCNVAKCVKIYMEQETEIVRWEWDNIADYVLLVAQLLTHFGVPRSEIREKILEGFIAERNSIKVKVPDNIAKYVVPQIGLNNVQQYMKK